jgi:hypothetical protein
MLAKEVNLTPMATARYKGRNMSHYMFIVAYAIAARMTRQSGGFLSYW